MNSLASRIAIVTGGGTRLGRAIALGLAGAGADVCIHYRSSRSGAHEVAESAARLGVRAITVEADLADYATAARQVVEACLERLGPASLLINNAAIFEPATLDSTTEETWRKHLDLNLAAPVFLSQAFARQIPSGQRGDIINLIDWRGLRPLPGHLSYTLAKAGLAALTKLLALELAPSIRVNGIAPGAILPPPEGDVEEFQRLASKVPLRKTGSPDDVVHAVLSLLTSEFITGEILHITGGQQL